MKTRKDWKPNKVAKVVLLYEKVWQGNYIEKYLQKYYIHKNRILPPTFQIKDYSFQVSALMYVCVCVCLHMYTEGSWDQATCVAEMLLPICETKTGRITALCLQ